MVSFTSIAKTLKNLKPHTLSTSPLIRFQRIRTLSLQSASEYVELHKLSGSDSGICEISLIRPETKNAIGKDMLTGLQNAFENVDRDCNAKVLLICSSVPNVFCAGADLKEKKTMNPSQVQDFVHSLRSSFSYLETLQVPTIAVIEGVALGGGMEMALSCDLRISGDNAVVGFPETGLAIIPGAGGTQRLPRLVGRSIAKDLIFTGRRISSREALFMGLVNRSVPTGHARAKALEIARDIIQKGPLAIRMAKRTIDRGLELDFMSAMEMEEQYFDQLLLTKDWLEGLEAFAEKRKPHYNGK